MSFTSISILFNSKFKKLLLLIIILLVGLQEINAQGATCPTAEILCTPNAAFPASTTGASLGAVPTCSGNQAINNCTSCTVNSTPNTKFYTLTVVEPGNLYLTFLTQPWLMLILQFGGLMQAQML